MSLTDVMLKRVEGEMNNIAQAALAKPNNRDAFEYGRVCGFYAGLNHTREMLLALGDEEDAKNF